MQPVNLGFSCMTKSTIQHEFLHALGFFHEQARPDRDEHIQVNWQNINTDNIHNYKTIIERGNSWDDMGTPYDLNSIMHYQSHFFLTADAYLRGEWTMLKKPEMTPIFPKSPRMTTSDSQELAIMYKYWCEVPETVQCENGEKILQNRFCDGVFDCGDKSDERDCGHYNCPRVIDFSSSIRFKDRKDSNGQILKLLQGKYSRQKDFHNGHVIYKMHGHPHFIYFSLFHGRWVINQEINERFTHILSLMGDVPCPSDSDYWTWWDNTYRRWQPVPDISLKCVGNCEGICKLFFLSSNFKGGQFQIDTYLLLK